MTMSFMSQSPAWMAAIFNGTFSYTMEFNHCTEEGGRKSDVGVSRFRNLAVT